MYFDEISDGYLSFYEGRFFLDCEALKEPGRLSHIKHYKQVLKEIEKRLVQAGHNTLYCIVGSARNYKFAKLFGFESNLEVYNNEMEVMRKGLI